MIVQSKGDALTDELTRGLGCLVVVVIISVFGYGAYWLWQQADDAGWIMHDKIAIVIAKGWSTGEYKICSQANLPGEPQLNCSSFEDVGEPKLFKVRFYGQTYREDLENKASFRWRCRKNEGGDPAFTCDEQNIRHERPDYIK